MNKGLILTIAAILSGSPQGFAQDTLAVTAEPPSLMQVKQTGLLNEPLIPHVAEGDRYKFSLKAEIPATLAGIGLFAYGVKQNKKKPAIDSATLSQLDPNDVNWFDRPATKNYSASAGAQSDVIFYAGYPLPLLLMLDREMRKDASEIYFMYLETMTITGMGWALTSGLIDRYRPHVYNPDAPMDIRTRGFGRNSFYGGHPSATAAVTFFMATIYSDYHPHSNFRYVLWGLAPVATAANAYLRYKGGYHFPSDLLIGVGVGAGAGLLIPKWHRTAAAKSFSLSPVWGEEKGFMVRYIF